MIPRYASPPIVETWSPPNKLLWWQETELAVIEARVKLGQVEEKVYAAILKLLRDNKIDIDWWLERDKEVRHDLNAFLDERLRFLPANLQQYFHDGLTSYDTEEPAFVKMIWDSIKIFEEVLNRLKITLIDMARHYRHTLMIGRTHGQEAELQSFGKRCLTWLVAIREGTSSLTMVKQKLKYSKLSGAIGNYRGVKPAVEAKALDILGLLPFYGATQIMPRELYAPIAQAVCQIVLTLDKIATDIRLGARSGRPIYQEPFGKKQKGSSAMPHKKNTILCEQIEGMARMAKGYLFMIIDNIKTWEERAIEQSCVERVAWPDLFHVAVHSANTMLKVLQGLVVYPDNMLLEIIDSCGCYAAGEVKEFLRHHGFATEDAYRIVQLAAFNAFKPNTWSKKIREELYTSLHEASSKFYNFSYTRPQINPISIQDIIFDQKLVVSDQLDASREVVAKWNDSLRQLFSDRQLIQKWCEIFKPEYLLEGEATLYKEILGDD